MPLLNQPRSETLVHAEHFLHGFGVTETPHMSPNLLAKMGLSQKSRDRNSRSKSRPRSDSFRRDDRPRYSSFDRSEDRPRRPRFDRDDQNPQRPRFERTDESPRRPRFDRDDERPRRPRFDKDEERPRRPRFESQGDDFPRRPKANNFDSGRSKRVYRD